MEGYGLISCGSGQGPVAIPYKHERFLGCVIAQVVSRWLPTAAAQVQTRV
jgi:hypothetical protein